MASYELYIPRSHRTPFPLILILPILGRFLFLPDFWIENKIAKFFARRGFASVVLCRAFFTFNPAEGLGQINDYLIQTVKLARETLDKLSSDDRINTRQVVSLGISFGGIINVLLMAEEPRVRASAIALAGGNIPEILRTSRDPLVKSYYRQVRKGTGLPPDEFVSKLEGELAAEPLKVAPSLDPKRILMIRARYDRVIFPRYTDALWEALGKPHTVTLPLGHYFSLLALYYVEQKVYEFFRLKISMGL